MQQGKPQYLTVINIRVTKLTQQDDFELGKRLFTHNICNNFGLLTNVPLPAVSIEISKEKLEASATRGELSITKEKKLVANFNNVSGEKSMVFHLQRELVAIFRLTVS